MIMNLPRFAPRALILALLLAAALASSSCNEVGGFGQAVPAGARWGGGSSGPGVFVGGPR
jgi:predicted small secreted protein